MRKMKRLFKARKRFIPLLHWSIIHFALNALSLLVLFVTSFFIELTVLRTHWMIACLVQLIPIFLVQFIAWIFEKKLSKNALAIIMRKLEENNIRFKNMNIVIKANKLYSCDIHIDGGASNKKQIDELLNIIHDINRKFGNSYNIIVDSFQYLDTNQGEK